MMIFDKKLTEEITLIYYINKITKIFLIGRSQTVTPDL